MAIIKDYYDGETHILIDDSAIRDQTKEEKKEKWQEFCDLAYQMLYEQHLASIKKSGGAGTPTGN